MEKSKLQKLILFGVVVIIIIMGWVQLKGTPFQSSVLSPYGYPGTEWKVVERRMIVGYGAKVSLNGLEFHLAIPNVGTPIRWNFDNAATAMIQLDNPNTPQTFFFAPYQDSNLSLTLEVKKVDGSFRPVAKYLITVVNPTVVMADSNHDGKFTFADLLYLLQHWRDFGDNATKALAIVLSKYE